MYTPSKIRESIRAAASRKSEFRQKRSGKHDEERRESERKQSETPYTVIQVLTDKGEEFIDHEMAEYYKSQGIEHVKVVLKRSQLNLFERTHKSLAEVIQATMFHPEFPHTFWKEAMRNVIYVKGRIYNKGTRGIPYEMKFGT